MKYRVRYIDPVLFVLLIILAFISCSPEKELVVNDNSNVYSYRIPEQINDGWETGSLNSAGMDEAQLVDLMNELDRIGEHKIHSILIVKDGKLVFEEYFPGEKFKLARYTGETGFNRSDTHTLCSATKSFTSALLGIAIDKGYLQSVNQKVFDFFPEYSDLLTITPEKGDLTIEHLLTMTSGLEYDDATYSYFDSRNDMNGMFESNEPARFLLSKELETIPGTVFKYNNNNTNILGEIIYRATGQRLDYFSENYLFYKLGITDFEWQVTQAGLVLASGELMLCSRDMAKFGQLFLNTGKWENERVISEEWISISTQKHFDPNNYTDAFRWADGYGYQWWLWDLNSQGRNFCAYMASGWGGQWIIQIPELDIVFVTTGGNYYTAEIIPIKSIIEDYIIPSILLEEENMSAR
ncbi:serine hydrolase domain-containing protein [candidate division KSB1 bacterium]